MKKRLSRILAVLICAVLLAGFFACGGQPRWTFESMADEMGCDLVDLYVDASGTVAFNDWGRYDTYAGGSVLIQGTGQSAYPYLKDSQSNPPYIQQMMDKYDTMKAKIRADGRKPVCIMIYHGVTLYYFIGVDGDGEYYVYPFSDTTSIGVRTLDDFVDAAVRFYEIGNHVSGGNGLAFD